MAAMKSTELTHDKTTAKEANEVTMNTCLRKLLRRMTRGWLVAEQTTSTGEVIGAVNLL